MVAHTGLRGSASDSAWSRIGFCGDSGGSRIGFCVPAHRIRRRAPAKSPESGRFRFAPAYRTLRGREIREPTPYRTLRRCSTGIHPPRPQACPPARPPPIPRTVHRAVHRALHSRATGPRRRGGRGRRSPPLEPPRPLHGPSAAASAGRCRIRRGITGTSRGNLGITRPGQRNPGSRIVHDGLDHGPARTAAEPEAGVRQDRQA